MTYANYTNILTINTALRLSNNSNNNKNKKVNGLVCSLCLPWLIFHTLFDKMNFLILLNILFAIILVIFILHQCLSGF